MRTATGTLRRRWRITAIAAIALAATAALTVLRPTGDAPARQTAAQKLFRDKLLESRLVSRDVKTRLRKGGFVDRRIVFRDLTGEGRSDAVVTVHSGGAAGRLALYILSSGTGDDLEIVYRNQRLYRTRARVRSGGSRGALPLVTYHAPLYEPGDQLCCPARARETDLQWSPRRGRFGVVARRTRGGGG